MVVQADAKTGPHHHGELETVLYVVKGRVRMRWGDHLELSEEARAGDFIYVPPYVPPRLRAAVEEINSAAPAPRPRLSRVWRSAHPCREAPRRSGVWRSSAQ